MMTLRTRLRSSGSGAGLRDDGDTGAGHQDTSLRYPRPSRGKHLAREQGNFKGEVRQSDVRQEEMKDGDVKKRDFKSSYYQDEEDNDGGDRHHHHHRH